MDLRRIFRDPYRYSKSNYFYSNFEEPTRLTFKLEFGGWGASVLSEANFKAQQLAVNSVVNQSYDEFPLGLFDLNFVDDLVQSQDASASQSSYDWAPQSFTTTKYYNAVNYLLSRNEDTRAGYMKAFIQGMMDIQRNTPYYFQKITGVDKLMDFDQKRGVRLKDCKLKIECLESLDLRMKTLLNLYRQAAWDDNYQRWILPDIYRKFKMIIYVSEIKRFHMPSPAGTNLIEPQYNQADGMSIDSTGMDTGHGIYSKYYGLWSEASSDPAIPVIAFECSPCEILISSLFENDLDINNDKAASTSFEISVENVRIYQNNPLMKKLNQVCISDLLTTYSRTVGAGGPSADKFTWTDRKYFNNDHIGGSSISHSYQTDVQRMGEMPYVDQLFYVDGFDVITDIINLVSAISSGRWTDMINPFDENYVLEEVANYQGYFDSITQRLRNAANYALRDRSQAINDLIRFRDSKRGDLQRNLEYLENIKRYAGDDRSLGTDYDGGPMFDTFSKPDFSFEGPEQVMTKREEIEIPDQAFVKRDDSYDLPEQSMPIREESGIPEQAFAKRDDSYDLPEQSMPSREDVRVPEQAFAKREDSYDLPEQSMPSREEVGVPSQQFAELDQKYEKASQEMPSLEEMQIPSMQLAKVDQAAGEVHQAFSKRDSNIEIPEQAMTKIENEISLAKQKLSKTLSDADKKSIMSISSDIIDLEKVNRQIKSTIEELKQSGYDIQGITLEDLKKNKMKIPKNVYEDEIGQIQTRQRKIVL